MSVSRDTSGGVGGWDPDPRAASLGRGPLSGRLLIAPVGAVDPLFTDFLSAVLPESTGLDVRVLDAPVVADETYDPVRRQWNAGEILKRLEALPEANDASRVLGITEADLYIPILTFVFGLAHLEARGAVVSTHRLRPELYGLPADPDLLLARLEKEALHELGHTGGLRHCPDFGCVMHFSNAVDAVDLKPARFCRKCSREFRLEPGPLPE